MKDTTLFKKFIEYVKGFRSNCSCCEPLVEPKKKKVSKRKK